MSNHEQGSRLERWPEVASAHPDFDPWTASVEEAVSKSGGITSPLFSRWAAAQLINGNRAAIEEGGAALILATNMLMVNCLTAPPWMAVAFLRCTAAFETGKARTLDEAFGYAPPTPRALMAMRKHARLEPRVHRALVKAIQADPTQPVDVGLFERVGDSLGIGKTLCRQLYDMAVQRGEQDIVELKRVLLSAER